MSTSFDPYHKWLGIPPNQQPAHHYRLLGVGLFEADADVIDAAANQRTAYLQELAAGEHVQLTQKLLNEITQARRCLLNPELKQAYDAQLQAQQPAPATKDEAAEQETAVPQNSRNLLILISLGIVTSLVLIVMMIFVLTGRGEKSGSNQEAGTLVIRWKTSQRQGATLEIDGEDVSLPPKETFEFPLTMQPGLRHRLVMKRRGYKPIDSSLVVAPTERKPVAPNWQREDR